MNDTSRTPSTPEDDTRRHGTPDAGRTNDPARGGAEPSRGGAEPSRGGAQAAEPVDGPLESLGKAIVEPVLSPERMSDKMPERGVSEDRLREQLGRDPGKPGRG